MKTLILAAASAFGALSYPVAHAAPQVFELTLPAGLGQGDWNTAATMVKLHVGDTLRVKNLDSTTDHLLHTPGQPCPHGGTKVYNSAGTVVENGENFDPIPVGGWLDCVLESTLDNSNGNDQVYDHFTNANFFIVVTQP